MAKDSSHWVVILNCTNYKLPHDFDPYGITDVVIAEDDPTFGSSTMKIDALQFCVAIAEFALKGSAMLTQALHHVMTPDAQELFLRESYLLSPDKNTFCTILTEIFSTVLSRTVSAMFTLEAHVNLVCTTWDGQMETLYPIVSHICDLEWYIDDSFSKRCCCHLQDQRSFKNCAYYRDILAELSASEELNVAAFARLLLRHTKAAESETMRTAVTFALTYQAGVNLALDTGLASGSTVFPPAFQQQLQQAVAAAVAALCQPYDTHTQDPKLSTQYIWAWTSQQSQDTWPQ
jgi:hypothetical protein